MGSVGRESGRPGRRKWTEAEDEYLKQQIDQNSEYSLPIRLKKH
jgi:hypothetical protein